MRVSAVAIDSLILSSGTSPAAIIALIDAAVGSRKTVPGCLALHGRDSCARRQLAASSRGADQPTLVAREHPRDGAVAAGALQREHRPASRGTGGALSAGAVGLRVLASCRACDGTATGRLYR